MGGFLLLCRDMKITSARFVKGIIGTDPILENGIPQVALIGRSNVGKSSIINSLANNKTLARTSSYPGLTQEINAYLFNESVYLLDLPGYGFARVSGEGRERLKKLLTWYLFNSSYVQKYAVLVIDAEVGPTDFDIETLEELRKHNKRILILANKVDKIKSSEYVVRMRAVEAFANGNLLVPYSSKKRIGVDALTDLLLGA